MSRLEIPVVGKAQLVVEEIYREMERRIESSPLGLCPIEMSKAFLELCIAQTCGKCTPCRVGLRQLEKMLSDILEGKATIDILDKMSDTAQNIVESADCAIGFEGASMIRKGLVGFRDEYIAHIEHGRCTCDYKQPVPCVSLCPAGVDIPGYISLVREGRYADAVRLIRKDNPFPTTCGYICEHPCEARCRRNMVDDAINIRGLKRMATELAGKVDTPQCGPSTGKKVAVVGGGPGGLSAAYYLQLMGHEVVVYEMLPKLGGMLRYGIPNYRLPKEKLEEDIDAVLSTGVKVETGVRIGMDITIDDLRKQFDAVLITIGASTDKKLGIEGENAKGVMPAVQFLRDVGKGKLEDLSGKEVCIVGGGNVSMDAVRTAMRLGARKVSIVYRRRVHDMTALPDEIEGAIAEGVEVQSLKAPVSIEMDSKKQLKGLWVRPQMISVVKDGRASVKPNGEEDQFIPCQTLIIAIGQDIEYEDFEKAGVPINRGKIDTQRSGELKDMSGVFAVGDCATGPATVIKAIASAKVAAANIDEYLGFHHEISVNIQMPDPTFADPIPCGRVNMVEREAGERVKDFEGVELPMTECECKQEASRCLGCDHYGYGIFKGGRETLW